MKRAGALALAISVVFAGEAHAAPWTRGGDLGLWLIAIILELFGVLGLLACVVFAVASFAGVIVGKGVSFGDRVKSFFFGLGSLVGIYIVAMLMLMVWRGTVGCTPNEIADRNPTFTGTTCDPR